MALSDILRFDTSTSQLRAAAFLEGLSFVLLLFVAMPLKYLADQPLAVRIVGMVHGLLFLWLLMLVLHGMRERGRTKGWGLRIGIASLLPFGTFFLDRGLSSEDEAFRAEKRE